jgi:hypothetical protein
MKTKTMTLDEVRTKGLRVLSRELGPYNYTRFLQQFEKGNGDYTKEREQLLSKWSVGDIKQALNSKRRKKTTGLSDRESR